MVAQATARQGQDLIDGLIATYRDLNLNVRHHPEETLRRGGGDGGSVRDVVRRLRDDELRFSQALKERLTGVPMPDIFGDDKPVLGTEHSDDSTAVLIAQFGTAREATLAMLHGMGGEGWDQTIEGGMTIRGRIEELVANDRKQLERIMSMVPSR